MPERNVEDPTVFRMKLRPCGARSLFLRFLPGFLAPWLFIGGLLVFCGWPNSAAEIAVMTIAIVIFVVACVMFAAALAADKREAFVRCNGNGASTCFNIDQVQSVALSQKDECIVIRDEDDVANLLRGRRLGELRRLTRKLSAAQRWARGKTPLHRLQEAVRLVRVYENNFSVYQLSGISLLGAMMFALAIGIWFVGDFRTIAARSVFSSLFVGLGSVILGCGIRGWKDRDIPTTITITNTELRVEAPRHTDVFAVNEIVDVLIDRRDDTPELVVRMPNDDHRIMASRTLQEQQDAVEWIRAGLLKARGLADD